MRSPDATLAGSPRGGLLALPYGITAGGLVFAATLPVVFLHVDYQPSVSLPLGATFKLQDALVLLTAAAAAATALRGGAARLRPGLPVWLAAAAFLAWVLAATFYPLLSSRAYAWKTHFVTAGEFCAYALLAPAVPLLLRRRPDALLAAGTLVAWSVTASTVAVVQWAGWSGLGGWGRGFRQPSFLGTHDLAALSGLVLGLGLLALLWRVADGRLRAGAWSAVVAGAVGFVLGGATAGVVGLVPAVVLAGVVATRRGLVRRGTAAAALAATAVAAVGVVGLRTGDFDQFFRFLGAKPAQTTTTQDIQTYSHRTVLAYIGTRIWLHHPIVGAGWQASGDPETFGLELPAARERFPDVSPLSFPAPGREYGVQVLYVQLLADLGLVGFVLFAALAVAGLAIGLRHGLRRPHVPAFAATAGVFALVLALGLWTAEGLVAGLPLDALTWLGLGLAASREVAA